jgi:methionyl-tRNA synthetase
MDPIQNIISKPYFIIPYLIWVTVWKGIALWKSANKKQLLWFVILLTINSMGILEILYVFYLNKRDIDNGKTLKFLKDKFSKTK